MKRAISVARSVAKALGAALDVISNLTRRSKPPLISRRVSSALFMGMTNDLAGQQVIPPRVRTRAGALRLCALKSQPGLRGVPRADQPRGAELR